MYQELRILARPSVLSPDGSGDVAALPLASLSYKNVPSVPLASLCPTFCTWCLLQEGDAAVGSALSFAESESTGDLI